MANNFLFAQVQNFSLAGAGAIVGDTSIILKSFKTIDGVNLAMTDFGSIGYGTIEPGNGTSEEQISFTNVVQNSNGTATLTGVKTVLFLSPYTETSGLSKTHAGSTTFVISNTSGFYNKFVVKDDAGTINQILTFATGATPLITDQPTTNLMAANKLYVDTVAIAGAPNASTTTKGISKLSVAPASAINPIAVGDNDPRLTPISSGTSGGILGFTGASTLACSVLLTQYALIVGGGAGATPVPLASLGTTSTVLHGNASGAPTYGAVVLTTDVSGILPVANGGTGASSLPFSGIFKEGSGTHTTGAGTFTIAHGLGQTPKFFRISYWKGASGAATENSSGSGSYNGTTQSSAYRFWIQAGSHNATGNSTTIGVFLADDGTAGTLLSFSISWDGTNITLTSNTDATFSYQWEAYS